MDLGIKKVSQIAQKWSKIIQLWGCNIECCRAIMMKMLNKNISSKAFYNKLLRNGVVSEDNISYYGYILDYFKMFEIFGIMDMMYNREYEFTKEMIIDLLETGHPVKARCKTGKNKYHFMLIVGYHLIPGGIVFDIIDPMERDITLGPGTWLFYDGTGQPTKRKLDRIEWFV